MDQYKDMVEAIFLKWLHVSKEYHQEMRIFFAWKSHLRTYFKNIMARNSDIQELFLKQQNYCKRKFKPQNILPAPRKKIVA